jgi:hypothetical protein
VCAPDNFFTLFTFLWEKTMNATKFQLVLLSAVLAVAMSAPAWADPLPGEILKFAQEPMIETPILNNNGVTSLYYGHDELSTAWAIPGSQNQYQGVYMADDFADHFKDPVVHVTWWGSYLNERQNPDFKRASRFLISFETDIPAYTDPATGEVVPSRPGAPILSQIVNLGPLAPQSGTFTEDFVRGPDPILSESLYKYNAELHCPFPEQEETVYWLKIVALDDTPQQDPLHSLQWGWHNRDYTIHDPLASTPLTGPVSPGEYIEGFVGPATAPTPVWHFQDDAVQGAVGISLVGPDLCDVEVGQDGWAPQRYIDDIDGPSPIGLYSKDLAFHLYTQQVPEPATIALLCMAGFVGLVVSFRKHKK